MPKSEKQHLRRKAKRKAIRLADSQRRHPMSCTHTPGAFGMSYVNRRIHEAQR